MFSVLTVLCMVWLALIGRFQKQRLVLKVVPLPNMASPLSPMSLTMEQKQSFWKFLGVGFGVARTIRQSYPVDCGLWTTSQDIFSNYSIRGLRVILHDGLSWAQDSRLNLTQYFPPTCTVSINFENGGGSGCRRC